MKDVIVISGVTHRAGMLDEYENQLANSQIDFHLEQLPPLPQGANSIHMRARIDYWRKVTEKFQDYKVIYITDAWDVLFYGTRQELIDKAPETMIVSAERGCYPEYYLADKIEGKSPWKFANNGMIASRPKYLLAWLEEAEKTTDLGILDQAWFNRRLVGHPPRIELDYDTNLFYVVSATENGDLIAKEGRPFNNVRGTFPNFLHFSGKTSPEPVKRMLSQ